MYELVNTSLPNGLIAGTHGFATVAMTKGMPDSLRTRVEAYCAYAHRTNAHDASYNRENPVNWFHAVLPQGEHVVGRTAPAEFDYTGRTNRLARTFVFGKNALPLVGGARVLLLERARVSEPWQGEARWLDEDQETEARLRREQIGGTTDAPAWRRMFGDVDGLDFARKFARLLAKNVRQGGKAISFKTSAARDADGMELLALFADLIDLLPFNLRSDVAFSTYSASWPNGSVCHLRGVYDRDRAFDMAATTQPWVDCENSTIHNASALPTEDAAPTQTKEMATPRTEGGSRTEGRPRPMQTDARPVQKGRTEQVTRYLPKRKDGTKALFIGLMTLCSLFMLAVVGAGVWFWRDSVRKNEELRVQLEQRRRQDAERQRAEEENARKIREEQKRLAEAARKEAKAKEAAAQKKAERQKAEEDRKQEAAASASEKPAHPEQPRPDPEETFRFAFTNATELVVGNPDLTEDDKKRLTNGTMRVYTMRVYWYDASGGLTNCPAGFETLRVGNIKTFTLLPKREERNKMLQFSSCILWYDRTKKILYWEWNLPEKKTFDLKPDGKGVDLQKCCFGSETNVWATWERQMKSNGITHYKIEAEGETVSVTNRSLTLGVLRECLVKDQIDRAQENERECSNKRDAFKTQHTNYQTLTNEYKTYCQPVENNKKSAKRKTGKKKASSKDDDGKASLKEKCESNIRELVREMNPGISVSNGSGDISLDMFKSWGKKIDDRLKKLNQDVTNAQDKLNRLRQDEEAKIRRPIRFTIKGVKWVECSRQGADSRKGTSK